MSIPSDTGSPKESGILGKLAGVVGLLGAALFFTGWIYRWAYFGYYQLDITALGFPFHSFLIVPVQVFLADGISIFLTALLLLGMILTIYTTLVVLRNLELPTEQRFAAEATHSHKNESSYPARTIRQHPNQFKLCRKLANVQRWFAQGNPLHLNSFRLLESFLNDVVIVTWILIFLFFYAQWRGTSDAQRDAYQCKSRLPAIAFVMPIENNPIARNFKSLGSFAVLTAIDTVPNEGSNPENRKEEMGEFGVIGDVALFDAVRQEIINNAELTPPRVWRLLLEADGWVYLISTLSQDPDTSPEQLHPPVLALRVSSGDQLMILRPEAPDSGCLIDR